MILDYWCSSKYITAWVRVDGTTARIIDAAPVWRRHIGLLFVVFKKRCYIDRLAAIDRNKHAE